MAILWPRYIPAEISDDPFRTAELKVYRKLEEILSDQYTVFYSSPWLGIDPQGREVDGECDFLIAHPQKGILTLEVKGGNIHFDAKTNSWTSINRYGTEYDIKDPIQQAKFSKHSILVKLNERNKRHKGGQRKTYLARHGAVFPDCVVGSEPLSAAAPRHLICDCEEFEHSFEKWILNRFSDDVGKESESLLGSEGIGLLEEILAKPFHLNIPLRGLLTEDDRSLDVLTREQFRILRSIEDIPRVAIPGSAGTGKTVLAVQEASNCALQGMMTLLTCYNDGLAVQIRRKIRQLGLEGIDVLNFHELCCEFAKDAGLPIPKEPSKKSQKQEYYEHTLPELFDQALDKTAKKYDAIIVDEGQDFRDHWWNPLLKSLRDVPQSRLRVFFDNNQRLYDTSATLPTQLNAAPVKLTVNLRNTKKIFELVSKYYLGHPIESTAPEGLDINWVEVESDKEIINAVVNDLQILTQEEKISPGDVALLVSSVEDVKKLERACQEQGIAFRSCDTEPDIDVSAVVIDTIRRFKGLESPAIILAFGSTQAGDRELIYVAISRARAFLEIIATSDVLEQIQTPDNER